ncbi:MAG: DUF433 domain-containing protein [Desulfomonile sp.]|nr:DUF433 domain-containing protein [Desulfomonile sp.]
MNRNLIRSGPNVMMGKPVIAGTRITVESILDKLAAGIILVRLEGLPPRTKSAVVVNAIREHGSQMFGSFTVITSGAIRIRPRQRP